MGFRDRFRFRTTLGGTPDPDGTFRVMVRPADGPEACLRYCSVLVASGHHWLPRVPELPGTFAGRVLHTLDYRIPEGFAGQRVLIVGMGNSACDIARVAERTLLASDRSPAGR